MTPNTYTEEEFKQVLKNLFAEKKRVKELQKQLEERGIQKKFQAKLADIHKFSLAEEYAKLKSAYADREQESAHYKKQFEKVRPALRRLVDELKAAQREIERFKTQEAPKDEFKELLEKATVKIRELEQEKLKVSQEAEAALQAERKHTLLLEEEKEELRKKTELLEVERMHLVDRLAESVGQLQRQTERIEELQENLLLSEEREKTALEEVKQAKFELAQTTFTFTQSHQGAEYELSLLKAEKEALEARIGKLEVEAEEARVAKTPVLCEHGDLQSDLESLQEKFTALMAQKEAAHEENLERGYEKMRELSTKLGEERQQREQVERKCEENEKQILSIQTTLKNTKLLCEERDAEIRKAQQHLAKKVKETTILHDLVERQKNQLLELQGVVERQKNDLEKIENTLQVQRQHEEKLQTLAKERTQAAEDLTKEWQEKYLSLQQDWQEKKGQLLEFQKMRKTYDQMATTFSSLKHILGNPLDSNASEKTDHSRD